MQITLVTKSIEDLQKGEAKIIEWDGSQCLFLCCYKCGHTAVTSNHTHEFHEDGTITINPSVVCPCKAHYFVRKSEIQEC